MQNTLIYNECVAQGFARHIPRKIPEEQKLPDIKPKQTLKMSDRDMEYNMHEQAQHYTPFKIKKKKGKKQPVTKRAQTQQIL